MVSVEHRASGTHRRAVAPRVGDQIRVERDEKLHPARGTWKQYRGRVGTVMEVNRAGRGATEYGIGFSKARRTDAWFKSYELVVVARAKESATDD